MTFQQQIEQVLHEALKNHIGKINAEEAMATLTNIITKTLTTMHGELKLRYDEKTDSIIPVDLWTALMIMGKPVALYDNSLVEWSDKEGIYFFSNTRQLMLKISKPVEFFEFTFTVKSPEKQNNQVPPC